MADIAILGAGASGLMAASMLAAAGIPCDLYEKKERCGLKIGITGKGRCNLTNACDPDRFRAHIMKGDLVAGANIAGFIKVADAMIAEGVAY